MSKPMGMLAAGIVNAARACQGGVATRVKQPPLAVPPILQMLATPGLVPAIKTLPGTVSPARTASVAPRRPLAFPVPAERALPPRLAVRRA